MIGSSQESRGLLVSSADPEPPLERLNSDLGLAGPPVPGQVTVCAGSPHFSRLLVRREDLG